MTDSQKDLWVTALKDFRVGLGKLSLEEQNRLKAATLKFAAAKIKKATESNRWRMRQRA